MITITHYRRELGWDRHAIAFVNVPYEPEKSGYYLGYDKPNYPMPAIPIGVTINAEFVGIWERGRGTIFYTDSYETVWY